MNDFELIHVTRPFANAKLGLACIQDTLSSHARLAWWLHMPSARASKGILHKNAKCALWPTTR